MQLILLFVSAFLVRLINLNQSLWLDESIVAKVVQTIPFHQIPFQLSVNDVHPPLYYMFMSLWSSFFGTSEIALRFPSVLFSLVAGWYINKIGGKWATVLFLFNPLIIYYAQEARMHMMATMLLSAALYHFLQILKKTPKDFAKKVSWNHNNIFLFNVFSALAMGVFYGSGFFIGAMIVVGFVMLPQKKYSVLLSIGIVTSLVALSPLLYIQILNSRAGLSELPNWSQALGNVDVKNIGLIFLKFATGRLSWLPKWSYYLAAGIPTAIIWLVVFIGMKKNKLLAALFILPLFFGVIVSITMPMMMYFRFLYLVPVMSLLIGTQIEKAIVGQIKIPIGYIILFLYCVFSSTYLFVPSFHREDWKSLSKKIDTHIPVYMIVPSSDPIAYYSSDTSVYELRSLGSSRLSEDIYVIPYTAQLYGFEYVKLLELNGCIKDSQSSFRGDLILEKWKCLRNS